MIHLSFLIGNLNKEHGGAQQLLYDLCSHLPSDEFDITVYYMFGKGTFQDSLEATGAEVVALEATSNYDLRAFVHLVRDLYARPVDILHTNSPISGAWGRTAGQIAGVPRIVSAEHTVHETLDRLAQITNGITLPLADVVIGVSEPVTRSITSWERRGLDLAGTRLETITNGVDVDGIKVTAHDSDNPLDQYSLEMSGPVVGTIGRHVEEKGYKYLLDAFRGVLEEYADATLVFLGDGPQRTALEQQAKQNDIDDAVLFVGAVPSVPPFFAQFDIAVFPSLTEGLPLSPAEAMAAGVPVIGTDIAPFRRLLKDGKAGVLVPPRDVDSLADAIVTLLDNPQNRDILSRRGRQHIIEQFSIERVVNEYAQCYRTILDTR